MAGRTFPAPSGRTHEVDIDKAGVEVRWSWLRELKARVLLLLGGGLVALAFGWPWFMVPDDLFAIKLLFAVVGGLLALVLVGTGLLAPARRFHVRLDADRIEVRQAVGVPEGTYPTQAVRAIVSTRAGTGRSGAKRGGEMRVGVHVEEVGPVGLLRTSDPAAAQGIETALDELLSTNPQGPMPVWPVAPASASERAIETDANGTPAGWPEHPRIGVDEEAGRWTMEVPAPSPWRRLLGYAVGLAPLVAITAGFSVLALWGPGGSWNPLAVLASPNAVALGVVGAWLGLGLYPSKRLVAWTHAHVGSGPYRIVVDGDGVTVMAAGHRVIDQFPLEDVLGFEPTRFGLKLVTPAASVRLPVYGLPTRSDRGWLQQALALAIDRLGGRELPCLELDRGASTVQSGPRGVARPEDAASGRTGRPV